MTGFTGPATPIRPEAQFVDRDGRLMQEGFVLVDGVNSVITRTGGAQFGPPLLPSFTVAELALRAAVLKTPAMAYCTNEAGGATLVFFDPAAVVWRRVADRAPIS
jgi:hypothetical protein